MSAPPTPIAASPLLRTPLARGVRAAAYGAVQAARVLWHTGHYAAARRLMGPLSDPGTVPHAEEFEPLDRGRLRAAFFEAFARDFEAIERGLYRAPREISSVPDPIRLWRRSRDYLRDSAKVARRKSAGGHSEVFAGAARGRYPRYYLQNFHFQTDGWLTAASAERYEMQVETLFTGAAGAMRRAALPMIADALEGRDAAAARLVDLGCGAGDFLEEVKRNWPRLRATALDLSPAYLGKARAALGRWRDVDFRAAPAEETGLAADSVDIVTAVYLFHELPPKARAAVASEIARILTPGGTLIVVDTLQYGDEPGLDALIEAFPRAFHEPYYDGYCRSDLESLFAPVGFVRVDQATRFLTKSSAFRKL